MAYKVGMLYLPDTEGYCFNYDPKTVTRRNKRTGVETEKVIWTNAYYCRSKEEAEAKKRELEQNGHTCDTIHECIY